MKYKNLIHFTSFLLFIHSSSLFSIGKNELKTIKIKEQTMSNVIYDVSTCTQFKEDECQPPNFEYYRNISQKTEMKNTRENEQKESSQSVNENHNK